MIWLIIESLRWKLPAWKMKFSITLQYLTQTAPCHSVALRFEECHVHVFDPHLGEITGQDLIYLRFIQRAEQARVQMTHLIGDPFLTDDQVPVITFHVLRQRGTSFSDNSFRLLPNIRRSYHLLY